MRDELDEGRDGPSEAHGEHGKHFRVLGGG